MGVCFSDFWKWCQDTSDIPDFLDAIKAILYSDSKLGVGKVTLAGTHSKMMSLDEQGLRKRHPLWTYRISDIMDESWFEEVSPLDADEVTVFTALEHMVLSGRSVLPLVARPLREDLANNSAQARVNSVSSIRSNSVSFQGLGSSRKKQSMRPSIGKVNSFLTHWFQFFNEPKGLSTESSTLVG